MNILRVKFAFPKQSRLKTEANSKINLSVDGKELSFKIKVLEKSNFRIYTLESNEFDYSIEDNTQEKIFNSIYLSGIKLNIGILMKNSLKSGYLPKNFLNELKNTDSNTHSYEELPYGVKISSSKPYPVESGSVNPIISKDISKFEKVLNEYLVDDYSIPDRYIRALEIYNSSKYLGPTNKEAVFILCMASIETLIEQKEVSNQLKGLIDSFEETIKKSEIEDVEKNSIKGSLSFLKKESITRSGKSLANKLLDEQNLYNEFKPSKFFGKAYNLRSSFVHDGKSSIDGLKIQNIEITKFTQDILESYFAKFCMKANY